jgi:hypothetical protein
MPKVTDSVPQPHIKTRAKNKTTHPGEVVTKSLQAAPRRTKAEVQQEKDAKAQAKKALAEARQQSINRAAEFERADIANEDMVDATPRPAYTPKPRPLSRNPKNSPLTDIEVSDELDETSGTPFMPGSESLVDADDSAVDSAVDNNGSPPPAEKKKTTRKAVTAAKVDMKKLGKTTDRKRRAVDVEGDDRLDSDEEQPQEPKPKRAKMKMRDEINVAATKILENEKGNKYAKMVNSIVGSSGKPVAKVQSHSSDRPLKREGAVANIMNVGGKDLKRQGAIADINNPDKSTFSTTRPDPNNNIR